MKPGAILLLALTLPFPAAPQDAPSVDRIVGAELKKRGLDPSERCADDVFIRRVFLDVIGTLPTPAEVRGFLSDRSPDKRGVLIEAVLARPEFAEYWALKWGDLLRIKSEFPSNLWPNAVQAYHRWLRDSLRDNLPYDRFARELLTSSGSNFRVPPVNFYRAFQQRTPRRIAENVALVFMGIRLEDAGLDESRILGLSAFFAKVGYKATGEWKEEIVYFDPDGTLADPKTGRPVPPAFPDGKPAALPPGRDPRAAFADWLTAPGNPWFARAIANRVWFWLMGRGIVHEPDDLRASNVPWSGELLSLLERELVARGFDLKHLYRLILASEAYQRASEPAGSNGPDDTGFSRYRIRRLDAEPLLDAINRVTGAGDTYTSSIPEPFTVLPADQRAIALADGSMESPFLETFGRPPRNTSFESERNSAPSVLQAQVLLNSSQIQRKIERSRVLQALAAKKDPRGPDALVEDLYIRVLSRFPKAEERRAALDYLGSPKRKPFESVCDLVWALINTKEFILKH